MSWRADKNRHSLAAQGVKSREAEFKLILPRYDNSGRKIKAVEYMPYINAMNKRFGGTSISNIAGCYTSSRGDVQCEKNILLTSYRDFDNPFKKLNRRITEKQKKRILENDYKFMEKLSKKAGKKFGQEGILFAYDDIPDASIVLGEYKKKLPKRSVESGLSDIL